MVVIRLIQIRITFSSDSVPVFLQRGSHTVTMIMTMITITTTTTTTTISTGFTAATIATGETDSRLVPDCRAQHCKPEH